MIMPIDARFNPIKGEAAWNMSVMLVPGGATPFITKRFKPKGGVIPAVSILIRKITANQTGSKPRVRITGTNIGRVIIIIATALMNIPRNKRTTIMEATRSIDSMFKLVVYSIRP